MIDLRSQSGRSFAVLGLARSGLAAAQALAKGGARVAAWDDDARRRESAAAAGVPIVDLTQADWSGIDSLVISPGIPHTHPAPHPVAARARFHGREIIGDIELLARSERESTYIGITGTNGKSTTTALIGHIMAACGRSVEIGGNIGTPALALAPLGRDGCYVLEMSSYQLEITFTITFDVAILLNVTPDHLDRHGGMDGYVAAKRLIFRGQKAPQTAVIGIDDEICRAIHDELAADARHRSSRFRLRRHWRAACSRRTASSTTRSTPARARSPIFAASRPCPERTTGRTPPPPSPRRVPSGSTPTRPRARCRPSRALPTGRN